MPLGVVSAVQEIGSVVGPLFGALVLAVADWRVIFLINLAVGLVLAAGDPSSGGDRWSSASASERSSRPRFDWIGLGLRAGRPRGRRARLRRSPAS